MGVLILGCLVVPALLGFAGTFTDYSPFAPAWHVAGTVNYQAVLGDSGWRIAAGNSLLLSGGTVPLAVLAGLALAGALRRPFRGRGVVRVLLLAPWLVSPIAAGVMWHFLYDTQVGPAGWLAAWLGGMPPGNPLADVHWALPAVALLEIWRLAPLATFLLLPGVLAVPQDDLDQAALAGCGIWTTWARVVVPRLRPLLLTVLFLLGAISLTTVDSTLILTGGGPGDRTATAALYSYTAAVAGHDWPQATAAAWLLAGAVLALATVYWRLLRRQERGAGL